jgi:hypothetical protein
MSVLEVNESSIFFEDLLPTASQELRLSGRRIKRSTDKIK